MEVRISTQSISQMLQNDCGTQGMEFGSVFGWASVFSSCYPAVTGGGLELDAFKNGHLGPCLTALPISHVVNVFFII